MSVINLGAGIDWSVIEDALAMKTDILLMQYLMALNLRLIDLKDKKGYNLLHLSVLAMKADVIHALVHYARDTQKEPREAIEAWLNERSIKDKFTPLHFASYKGHFATI
jgi:ankyrin repeat protein